MNYTKIIPKEKIFIPIGENNIMNTKEYQMNNKPVEVSWYWIALFFIAFFGLMFYGLHLTDEMLALRAV